MQRATIEFPRSVGLEEAERLLSYVSLHLPANIHYLISQHKDLRNDSGSISTQLGTFELGGSIQDTNKPRSFDSFNAKSRYEDDEAGLWGLSFSPIPGYSLREHRTELVQLWDDTRAIMGKYFEEKRLFENRASDDAFPA